MCGLAGWIFAPGTDALAPALRRMADSLRHRGPDDCGEYLDPASGVALAHRRLSIIDLTPGGHQPMLAPDSGDALVFNGEIYNFRELRGQLEAAGHRLRSGSDTEVLLRGLACWGVRSCLERLRGMYAFAYWQPAQRRLTLARDPMGIKPLYYWQPPGGGCVFASEVKAFWAFPDFPRRIDRRSLGQFLEFGYTFDAERTMLDGVRKLPPGHLLEITEGRVGVAKRFFDPCVRADPARSGEDWADELYATLSRVVAEHLVADVPVGLLLSGGLDSSLLAAMAARCGPLDTFSMGFGQSAIDERPYAREVADHIGARHHEILIRPEEVRDGLETTIRDLDDLFADWGTVSTKLLYRKCRERGIKVVIVGEGADELFGGYPIFREARSTAPRDGWLFQLYRRYAGRRYGRYFFEFRRRMGEYLARTEGDRFAAIRLFETRHQLPNNFVMKVDKASMAVSVEARVPFLDQRVAELAYRVPAGELLSAQSEKNLLRGVAERHGLLPEATLRRRKFGAGIATSWMDESEPFRHYARDIILQPGSWVDRLGLRRAMTDYFVHGRRGDPFPYPISIFPNLAWRLLALELWARAYAVVPD